MTRASPNPGRTSRGPGRMYRTDKHRIALMTLVFNTGREGPLRNTPFGGGSLLTTPVRGNHWNSAEARADAVPNRSSPAPN